MLDYIVKRMYEPRDPSALGIARFFYGLIIICDLFEERGLPYILDLWGDPSSCHFPLFNNLPRLDGMHLHMVFLVMLVSAFFIMLGFLYRLACFTYMLTYWYIFFLDKTKWNNHSYLYGLLSVLFFFTNGNYYWSVDSLIWPSIRNKTVPRWHQGIIKFQVFIVYFFAGIKKLDRDWWSGYSMVGLSKHWTFEPFRLFMNDEQIDFFIVHLCGLILDLTASFLMYFDKTRWLGFALCYQFHIMTAFLFNIGMFPYACMVLIPIFCYSNWPKKIFRRAPLLLQRFLPTTATPQENLDCFPSIPSFDSSAKEVKDKKSKHEFNFSLRKYLAVIFCMLYVTEQTFLPWSHSITQGYNSWTQGLYGYSWDMMVHSWNAQHTVVKVVDGVTNETIFLKPGAFASRHAKRRIFGHPDMIKQYAVCLADRVKLIPGIDVQKPKVYFDIWKSLNKRFQQRMVDPTVDIVTADWHPFTRTSWMRPLLTKLSPWREALKKIKSEIREDNSTDIVFVADFPGLHLENYIAPEIKSNVTVLQGTIIVEQNNKNVTVIKNETLDIDSNVTHKVYTVGNEPSCYMYIYENTTWRNLTEEEIIKSDPELRKQQLKKEKYNNRTVVENVVKFYQHKFSKWQSGLSQLYFATKVALDIGNGKNDDIVKKEEL